MSEERGAGGERGRWSSRRKTEVVLRALRGEDLDALSRELGVTPFSVDKPSGTCPEMRQLWVSADLYPT